LVGAVEERNRVTDLFPTPHVLTVVTAAVAVSVLVPHPTCDGTLEGTRGLAEFWHPSWQEKDEVEDGCKVEVDRDMGTD